MSTLATIVWGSVPGPKSTRRGPAAVATITAPCSRPWARAQPWTRQRMPLPLISAVLPSEL